MLPSDTIAKHHSLSIAVPTYRREQVLLDTLEQLLAQDPPALEILVMDQTEHHQADTESHLQALAASGKIRWERLPYPSIPAAMNQALLRARGEIVLFLDDDIRVATSLVDCHLRAHQETDATAVVGQVIQPWEEPLPIDADPYHQGRHQDPDAFRFNASRRYTIARVMAGNLSLKRYDAIKIGGFDENFVRVAYRFEAEFADRLRASGGHIVFEPTARLDHLKVSAGGTRFFGEHLTTVRPDHTVGEYYYLLQATRIDRRLWRMLRRPLRAVATRHHLRHPWWIPGTLLAEVLGLSWALYLWFRGPRYIASP